MDSFPESSARQGASAGDEPGLHGSLLDPPGDILAEALQQLDLSDSLGKANIANDVDASAEHDNRRDLVAALPPELVAEIFRQLDFNGRLAVSHVCKAWRRAALSDRFMWSEYHVPQLRPRRAIEGFTALLSRSSPLPFRMYCKGAVMSAIVDLVLDNVERLELIHLGKLNTLDQQRLIPALDALLLKHFACQSSEYVPTAIPAGWALHLEHLEVDISCFWPAGCVFRHLRSFRGSMPQGNGFGAPISHCFPSLRSLNLFDVTQTFIESMAPLPRSLTVLKLDALHDVDCAELLRNCAAQDLQELDIFGLGTTPSILETLRLFTRTVSGPWRMQVEGAAMLLWALPYHYIVYCSAPDWLSREPGIPLCWDRLCELHLPMTDFEQLMAGVSAGLVLPMLSTLTLTIERGYRPNPVTAAPNAACVHAPVLHTVELYVEPTFDSIVDMATMLLRMVRALVPLELLIVHHDASNKLDTIRVPELRGVVSRVEIRDFGNTLYSTFRP